MSQTKAPEPCPYCQQENEPGMSFCMYCGKALSRQAQSVSQVREQQGQPCTNCGKVDYLSNVFCVFCGADMTVESVNAELVSAAQTMPQQHRAPGAVYELLARHQLVLAAITGVILGLPLSVYLVNPALEKAAAGSKWPGSGLVIYALPAGCQVMLEESSGARFIYGHTGAGGELAIGDLAPGAYRVTFSYPGLAGAVHNVTIKPDKVSVLGFPKRIDLTS